MMHTVVVVADLLKEIAPLGLKGIKVLEIKLS